MAFQFGRFALAYASNIRHVDCLTPDVLRHYYRDTSPNVFVRVQLASKWPSLDNPAGLVDELS